jgi:hypothetical protein
MFSFYTDFSACFQRRRPSVGCVLRSSFRQALHDQSNLFMQQHVANDRSLWRVDGLHVNVFIVLDGLMSAVALGCAAEALGGEGRLRRQRRPDLRCDRFLSLDTQTYVYDGFHMGHRDFGPRIGAET